MDTKNLRGLMEAYQQVNAPEQIGEATYSAKAARAGKDIGKPGKAFAKIAASAGERYGCFPCLFLRVSYFVNQRLL